MKMHIIKVARVGASEFGRAFMVERCLAIVSLENRVIMGLLALCAIYSIVSVIRGGVSHEHF